VLGGIEDTIRYRPAVKKSRLDFTVKDFLYFKDNINAHYIVLCTLAIPVPFSFQTCMNWNPASRFSSLLTQS
jgi:hypothetical protein